MGNFVVWTKSIDEKFREAYLAKTGEKIGNPLESEDGLSYMAISWIVSEKHLDELKADTNITSNVTDIQTVKDMARSDWIEKKLEI